MNDLDFTMPPGKMSHSPPAKPAFDPAEALEFFKAAGSSVENVAAGKVIFSEDEKAIGLLFQRNKMYLLLDGDVVISAKQKLLGVIKKGEIFGEMSAIAKTPRSATATAQTACSLIALDDKQLYATLRKRPEFALTLMSVLAARLRSMLNLRNVGSATAMNVEAKKYRVFDKKMLAYLAGEIGDSARMNYGQGNVIMQEGQVGVLMYVVQEGSVSISIQDNVIEKVGAGGVFGEMALIDGTKRLASAVAETDCSLLAINRGAFLNLVKNNPDFGLALLGAVGERAQLVASLQAL